MGVVDHDLFQRRTSDWLVARGRDRHGHRQAIVSGWCGRVPARPDDGIALPHQVAGAGILCSAGIIDRWELWRRLERKIQGQIRDLVAPIGHITEQDLVAARCIQRFQEIEVGRVLDLAAGVARRQRDVGDDRVERALGIQLAKSAPHEFLISPGLTERRSTKCRRLDAIDNHFCDHGFILIARHCRNHEGDEETEC
ncbi:MAG: hypothetical protein HY268_11295 [Deltaproteobacteria bacterium]|nr:hypothetical protein [Deltaproteobacteria bacterium]